MNKVIVCGSGPGGVDYINKYNTEQYTIVGVNNVWKGTEKWNHLIYAGDYYDKDKIKYTSEQKLHSRNLNMGFEKSYKWGSGDMQWDKARVYCGLPIYFTTMYWALYYLKPQMIGCIGFDMDYTPQPDGSTSFYGLGYDMSTRGVPDPLYQFRKFYKDLKDPMGTLLKRLEDKSSEVGCKIVNLSDNPKTQLKWEYNTWEQFNDTK
jgi:hypothetical protein